jgi:hypothetical protein
MESHTNTEFVNLLCNKCNYIKKNCRCIYNQKQKQDETKLILCFILLLFISIIISFEINLLIYIY